MVNRGRPSNDCLPCKKRKLRCDLRSTGCSQCQRAKLLCHGYRNSDELLIRDETDSTRQKVLARQALAYPMEPRTLQLRWEVRARQSFFSDYVFGFSRSYDILAPLYGHASATGHLSASVDAASLAFMCIQWDAPSLRYLAKERYVLALQKVGHALRTPEISSTDETLQSILLLDLYEKLVNRDPQSSLAWTSHVFGAVSLVKSCGNKMISSHTGCRLATRLATTLAITCGAASMRIPDALVSLRIDLSSFVGNAKWDFTSLVVDMVNLKADITNRRFNASTDIVERAKNLDGRFVNLETMLPSSWMPQHVFISKHPLLFGRYYDVYVDHYTTQVRNAIRTVRLILNNMILEHCPRELSVPRIDAAKTIGELAEHICAAITHFILPVTQQSGQSRFSPLQRLQCFTLIPPLYIAGQLSPNHALREWTIQVLEYMAEAGTMKTAKDVAAILQFTPDVDYWKIYSMVGCYALAA